MLANSVTVRIANLTAVQLLNTDFFDRVTAGLAFASLCSTEALDIFSLVEDSSTTVPILNITFSVRDVPHSRAYIKSDVIKERLFTKRAHFRNMTFLEIMPFDDSLCAREPCPNFETCATVQKFGQAGHFISTSSFFFRSIQPVTTFQCKCPAGYTGMAVHYSCDTEVNLCYSSPCQNNGTCISVDGGYQCECKTGFRGDNCEINLAMWSCSEDLCQPPAICSLTSSQLVQCTGCPSDEFHTTFCELTTRSFGELESHAYAVFPGIRSRNRLSISLSFATNHKSGLLLYNGRHSDQGDFIEIRIVNGSIQFAFSLGNEKRAAVVPLMVSDGEWHNVRVEYYNKTAIIALDDCDTILSLEHGADLQYRCAATIHQELDVHCSSSGSYECLRFLDLTGPLYLGGLPEENAGVLPSTDTESFRGCVKDVKVNHKQLDMNQYMDQLGTQAGCPQKKDFCADQPCLNGGTCVNEWKGHFCRCPHSFDQDDCSTGDMEVFQLDGDGYMLLQSGADHLDISFDFRTVKQSGTLIHVKLSNKLVVTITVRRQYVVTRINSALMQEGEVRVADEMWHTLHLTVHDGLLAVFLDNTPELQTTVPIVDSRDSINVVLGGHETLLGHPHGFTGCVRNIFSAKRALSPSFRSNVRDGCSSLVGSCETTSCAGEYNECVDDKHGPSCGCQRGFIGSECKDVCSFDPCKNGICVHSEELTAGYECKCFANYTGQYCEQVAPQSCPVTWWGYPVCGPCRCDTDKGFDPRCHRKTGECSCKENFYRPLGSDRCIECGCYFRGAVDARCDDEGRCICKSGVTGERCDQCLSPFAEVTEHGCEVVHDSCPRSFADGIWWERASYGTTAFHNCPRAGFGKATRRCDHSSKSWRKADVTNCTSLPFDGCLDLLNEIRSGAMLLDTYSIVRVVSELQKALNVTMSTSTLFAHDVILAGDLLSIVFKYESMQNGMNLTHRLDRKFLPGLLDALSHILDPANYALWNQNPSRHGIMHPASLTSLYHSYLRTILTHFPDTYMSPFDVITRNFKSGVQCLTDAPFPTIHPRLKGFTKVFLPTANQRLKDCQLLFYTEYADLPSIIHTGSNSSQHLVALTRAFYLDGKLTDSTPTYQFMKIRPTVSGSPQCMTFSFSTATWVPDGCSAISENATHINCSCSLDQLVAVMGDAHLFSNIFRSGLPVFLFSAVTMVLAIIVNFAAFILLLATRSKSGVVGLYQNVIFVALFTDCCFVLAADVTWTLVICKLLSALLHFAFIASAAWCVLLALHVYYIRQGRPDVRSQKTEILVGYLVPMVFVAIMASIFVEAYGAEPVCWMLLDDLMVYSLVVPAMVLVTAALFIAALAQCVSTSEQEKKIAVDSKLENFRRELHLCLVSALFTGIVITLAVLSVSTNSTALGFVFPAVVFGQSVFFLVFLCLGTGEVASLIDEKLVWIVRKKLTSLTASHSAHKLNNNNVRETFRNPGISISNSTTFHRAVRPDGDLSGSFEPVSAFSTMTRNNHLMQRGTLEALGTQYPNSHKGSDGTNDDTVSVRSNTFLDSLPHPNTLMDSDDDSEFTAYRGHPVLGGHERSFCGTNTFGTNNVSSWSSLPHRAKTDSKSPNSFCRPMDRNEAIQSPKMSTFRPASKTSQNAGQNVDGVFGETYISRSGSSGTLSIPPPPEAFRGHYKSSRLRMLPDVISHEGGTAV